MASPLTPEEQRGLFGDPSSSPAAPQTSTAPAPSTAPLTPAQQQALFPNRSTSQPGSAPPQGGWADAFQAGTYRGLADIVNAPSAWFGWKPVIDTEGDLLTSGEKQAAQAHPYVASGGRAFGQAVGTAPLAIAGGELIPAVGGAGVLPSLARGAVTGAGMGAAQNLLTAGEAPQENLLTRAARGAAIGGVLGTVGGAAEPLFGAAKTITPEAQAAGQRMANAGVDVTGPQLMGGAAASADQVGQFNRAYGNIFGQTTPDFSASTLNAIMPKLGQDVGNAAAAGQINAGAMLPRTGLNVVDTLNQIKTDYAQIPQVQRLVRDAAAKFDPTTGAMQGSDFQSLIRDSSPLDLATGNRNADVAQAAMRIKQALQDGFAESSPQGVMDAYSLAREKYKLAIAAKEGADAQGNLVPGKLYSALERTYGDISQMGQVGSAGLSDQAVQFARDAQRLYSGPKAPGPSFFGAGEIAPVGAGALLWEMAPHVLPSAVNNPLVAAGLAVVPQVARGLVYAGQRYQMTPGFGANLLARGAQGAGPYLAVPSAMAGNALMPQGQP